jgi:hypothetical protein
VQSAEVIVRFLGRQKATHNNPSILDIDEGYETQTNVSPADGEQIKSGVYSDGCRTWYNWRIDSEERASKRLGYPPEVYAKEIGSTGWSWREHRSHWVGFDFDLITAHAPGTGISKEELDRIREAVKGIPWVEVRLSTSGTGLHLVVHFFDGIPTANRAEHMALARCVLGMISEIVGFDLTANVDACGQVLWLWSRRATAENHGFQEIKPATEMLAESKLPANWKDYVEVVTRKRGKVRVRGVENEERFDKLAARFKRVPLNAEHKADITALTESGYSTLWVSDHHLLQTHTCALQETMRRGIFKTNSEGTDRATPNCFLFPMTRGWKVYRFSPGTAEAETWNQDGEGWTWCYWNRMPDLATAANATGGVEDPERGGYVYETAEQAEKGAQALGFSLKLPERYRDRQTRLIVHKDGRIVAHVAKQDGDSLNGWLAKTDWVKVFGVRQEEPEQQIECDDLVRVLVTPNREHAGYMVHVGDGWDRQTATNAKMYLQSHGCQKPEAEAIIGAAVARRWKLVNLPFQPEFLGDRQWNLDAAQYRVRPADTDEPVHPWWDKVLAHIGANLDEAVKQNGWCQQNEIRYGREWLLYWIATCFRKPFEPNPYLALFGPEDSGKSILHEGLSFIVTKGIVPADRALTNPNNFNGELAGGILAVVEETDLGKSATARQRMKEWVTTRQLSIRAMRTNVYTQPNTLHFLQCCNHLSNIPTWPGDTRIVVCFVPKPANPAKKPVLLKALEDEAPMFLKTLLSLTLPEPDGRTSVAVLDTDYKIEQAEENAPVVIFLRECCAIGHGHVYAKSLLYAAYVQWCEASNRKELTREEFGRQVLEFGAGIIRPRGKVLVREEHFDGKVTERRHDAYQGICLKAQPWLSTPVSAPVSPSPTPDNPTPTCS